MSEEPGSAASRDTTQDWKQDLTEDLRQEFREHNQMQGDDQEGKT